MSDLLPTNGPGRGGKFAPSRNAGVKGVKSSRNLLWWRKVEDLAVARPRHHSGLAAICLLGAALVLAGCGRKGPLDLPPTASVQPSEEGQVQSGAAPAQRASPPTEYGRDDRPLAPRGPKRRLPIDWLID
jgi:predicted small lipoprotein YifL